MGSYFCKEFMHGMFCILRQECLGWVYLSTCDGGKDPSDSACECMGLFEMALWSFGRHSSESTFEYFPTAC